MENTAIHLLVHIIYEEKKIEMNSEDIIEIEEIKKKIKEEWNISEELLNNMCLLYTDSDGDINLIIDNDDLLQIIEQKQENEFLTEIKLELIPINNVKVNLEQDNNDDNINNNDINEEEEKKENRIKELEKENKILKKTIDYYINVIKDIKSHYEKMIRDILYNGNKVKYTPQNNETIKVSKYIKIENKNNIEQKNENKDDKMEKIVKNEENKDNVNLELEKQQNIKYERKNELQYLDNEENKAEKFDDKNENKNNVKIENQEDLLDKIKEILEDIKIENNEEKLKYIKVIIDNNAKIEDKNDNLNILKISIIENEKIETTEEKLEVLKITIENLKIEAENNKIDRLKNVKKNKKQKKPNEAHKIIISELISNIYPLDLQKELLEFEIPLQNCKLNKISNLLIELKNSQFQCKLCENFCKKNIFNCSFCESFYLCEACHKNLNKNKNHEHQQEYFIKIKFPNILNDIINYNSVLQEFDILMKEAFNDIKKINEFDFNKKRKIIIKTFFSHYKNALTYLRYYEQIYITPKFENLTEEEKTSVNEKVGKFNLKIFYLSK